MNGKAVNAIRSFPGEGIKVWGARTMDGNSLDWRYINVRRTMIFLEESIKNAARAYVFEPNVVNTWVNMRSMIDGFLRGVWKRGGLAGTSPEDAYSIHIGLGDTMTPEDILEGILRYPYSWLLPDLRNLSRSHSNNKCKKADNLRIKTY